MNKTVSAVWLLASGILASSVAGLGAKTVHAYELDSANRTLAGPTLAERFLNDFLESLGSVQYRMRLVMDGNSENEMNVESFAFSGILDLSKKVLLRFSDDPVSDKSVLPYVILGEPGLRAQIDAVMDPEGKLLGKIHFQRRDLKSKLYVKTPLAVQLKSIGTSAVGFRLNELHWVGKGLKLSEETISLRASCDLEQELVVVDDAKNSPTEWEPVDCEYKLDYNKETGRYKFKVAYDSHPPMTEISAGNPPK